MIELNHQIFIEQIILKKTKTQKASFEEIAFKIWFQEKQNALF
jgi:hypothetical protein